MDPRLRNSGMTPISLLLIISLIFPPRIWGESPASAKLDNSWANWDKRFERYFSDINPHYIPGRAMGIIVPSDPRPDLLPMSAFGYETISRENFDTVIIILPAPENSTFDGLAVPDLEYLETPIGRFKVDTNLLYHLQNANLTLSIHDEFFDPKIPAILETQLAALKFVMKKKIEPVKILPILVKVSDLNSQVKDFAPAIAENLKDLSLENKVVLVVVSNLSLVNTLDKIIPADAKLLTAIRSIDVDAVIESNQNHDPGDKIVPTNDAGALAMGILIIKWLGADHGEILAWCHSGQLVLTKDKTKTVSFVSAAFASGPLAPPKVPHVEREKMVDTFDELLRTDILTITRQTCAQVLDPTAAAPPALVSKEASKKWPLYVSLFDPQGKLAGQAGSHIAGAPLQESLRQYAFEAVRKAQPALTKDNFQNYVVDVSIPYGFNYVSKPEDLVPFLNGVIVHQSQKQSALHPEAWRTYPDPHEMLGFICYGLGMKPWDYATVKAEVESFRVIEFNEKEPFQDLGETGKKKKKKKGKGTGSEEAPIDNLGTGGDALPF